MKTKHSHEEFLLLNNSIERVINTSIRIAQHHAKNEAINELADVNLQDWEELKQLTVRLWNDARNRVFKGEPI